MSLADNAPGREGSKAGLLTKVGALLGGGQRWRWAALAALALVGSALEATGAVMTLLVLRIVSDPQDPIVLPVVGDLQARLSLDDEQFLLAVSGCLAAFFLMRGAFVVFQAYVAARVANNAGARLAARLVMGYLRLPWLAHVQRNSAELVRNATETVQVFVTNVLLPSVVVVADLAMIVALLAVLVVTAPAATAGAVLTMAPLIFVLMKVVRPKLNWLGWDAQQASGRAYQALEQGLGGLRDIRLLGKETDFADTYARTRRDYARAQYLRNGLMQLPRTAIETGLVLLILLLLAGSVVLADGTASPVPTIGLFAYVGLRLQPSLQRLVGAINNLRYAGPAIDELYADLCSFSETDDERRLADVPVLSTVLEVREVSFTYPGADRRALDEVSVRICKGQSVGIVGPTGSGKSSLVDVLIGLVRPDEGQVEVDGVAIWKDVRSWRAQLGVVPQTVYLFDDTIRRNVALGEADAAIDDAAIHRALHLAQLTDFVASLPEGVETRLGERGVRLSGGQRQRIAIARALYHDPEVIVFDEGTSALDNTTEALLVTAIEALKGTRTVITVAHRLSTVLRCDLIVYMEHGRVAAAGDLTEVIEASPAFREMAAAVRP